MIFFFGTRSTKVKERQLMRTTCPYCSTQDSFRVATYSTYFHFFWIPIIPLFKRNVAECTHCKKTYAQAAFTPEMKNSLDRINQTDPAKRPLWQGIGCLLLVAIFGILFIFSLYGVYQRSGNTDTGNTEVDIRKELLEADMGKMTSMVRQKNDAISFDLKKCVDYDIVSGLDTDKIAYFSKLEHDKLLVLLQIEHIKQIKPEFRKDIIDIVEDCLYQMEGMQDIQEFYIGVEGRWNTVLVKTPTYSALGGRFADSNKLLDFYGEQTKTETNSNQDTLSTE